jgi:hypothetical protein
MKCVIASRRIAVALVLLVPALTPSLSSMATANEAPADFQLRLDTVHSWRPPFGLDRVGLPIVVAVETSARPGSAVYILEAFSKRKRVAQRTMSFPVKPPYSARLTLDGTVTADELVLSVMTGEPRRPVELARQAIQVPEFEADARAIPDTIVNPVDLGTILVPEGWLLLGPGQTASLEVAAISRTRDILRGRLRVSFDRTPARVNVSPFSLHAGDKARLNLKVPEPPPAGDSDRLSVVIVDEDSGALLWRKQISVMLVRNPSGKPRFGATYERLRYDAPISVREPGTGKFSSASYQDGWNPELRDVVVWLPNGGRFIFWRGSSYIPFWAGLHNTGACYEWAEIISQPKGAVDCVEPLMDKELRYGRVEIIESTSARVHVRWSYQSTDFNYKVWGDVVVEDYFFYPDGFGTRVVNLKSDPKNDYELSEFIILTPQGAFPFAVLPDDPVDALYLDGRKHHFRFPNSTATDAAARERDKENVPAIYRLRLGKNERLSAVYFSPNETRLPGVVFAPFFDGGQMVTPCYWGSHWPLARGNSTGSKIDDRIEVTPTHSSVMSWAGHRPAPLASGELITLDSLGRSRSMNVRRWAWLIGMSDATDAGLIDRAKSFATPPSLELRGARLSFAGYVPERRAIRLEGIANDIRITINPAGPCLNPVVEFASAPGAISQITLAGRPLDVEHYAWDGRTLWLDATIETSTELRVTFGSPIPGRLQ